MADEDERIAACRRAERRATARIIFWTANVPVVVGLYALDRPLWDVVSILYLALVSVAAMIESPYASLSAKKAERRALEET